MRACAKAVCLQPRCKVAAAQRRRRPVTRGGRAGIGHGGHKFELLSVRQFAWRYNGDKYTDGWGDSNGRIRGLTGQYLLPGNERYVLPAANVLLAFIGSQSATHYTPLRRTHHIPATHDRWITSVLAEQSTVVYRTAEWVSDGLIVAAL